MRNRNYAIDVMKGIGIFLVVLGHLMSPRSPFIYSFHMPLFFILGGFLFKSDGIVAFIKHKLFTIGIPILTFNAVYLIIYIDNIGGGGKISFSLFNILGASS